MSTPLLGQFDPEFTAIMNEVMELICFAFETENQRAFPVPGTGRAGLEAAITSLVEPGGRVVVGECGRFACCSPRSPNAAAPKSSPSAASGVVCWSRTRSPPPSMAGAASSSR